MILSGRDVKHYMNIGKIRIDPIDSSQLQQNGVDLILDDVEGRPEYFEDGVGYLGCTRETLTLPNDIVALVGIRSTWARLKIGMLGLTWVDAGFEGNLTLEIFKARSFHQSFHPVTPPVKVPYGERFVHLVFAHTLNPCDPYRGKYQGQKGITQARRDD